MEPPGWEEGLAWAFLPALSTVHTLVVCTFFYAGHRCGMEALCPTRWLSLTVGGARPGQQGPQRQRGHERCVNSVYELGGITMSAVLIRDRRA